LLVALLETTRAARKAYTLLPHRGAARSLCRFNRRYFTTMKISALWVTACAVALTVALAGCNRSGTSSTDQASSAAAVSGAAQSGPAVSAPATAASDAPAGASQ
jgi:hypothetical protein